MQIAGNGKWMGITNFLASCEMRSFKFNKTGFQPVSRTVEQEVEFFKEVKMRLAKV